MASRRSAARRGGRPYRRLAANLRREGVVCHLCGNVIDVELRSPHPLSFTLDHLVPLGMVTDPVEQARLRDDPHNVRPAHRLCNMKRGTGRGRARTEGDRSAAW